MSCALSGGPDSAALVVLAVAAGCRVTAHHVDHAIRHDSAHDARVAADIAETLDVPFVVHRVDVASGPNLEARAREARLTALPPDAMTGHTADDQAETLLLRLLRGSGADGLAGMRPGLRHPILALRRDETRALCAAAGLQTATDPSNDDPSFTRNRVRAEVVPLLEDVARRDVVPLLVRTADLLRDDAALLDDLATAIDATDANALVDAPVALARRAVRRWLTVAGYPPDAAAVERVLDVARGTHVACELDGGRRVERSRRRLRVVDPAR